MLAHNSKILLYGNFVDMRKSINGLSLLVSLEFGSSINDTIYIFYSRNHKMLKLLYWDKNGWCMFYKILSKCKFKIPLIKKNRSIRMEELQWLLSGLDIDETRGFSLEDYDRYI